MRTTTYTTTAPPWAEYANPELRVDLPTGLHGDPAWAAAHLAAAKIARRVYGRNGIVHHLTRAGTWGTGETVWQGFVGRLRADGTVDGRSIHLTLSAAEVSS